mmetsp:Transcript_5107/g.13445  ORF Transcript_5107/g.13445 Transcript_5107/m.13445 type:complete len:266 (-) Transcript_5107:778-1575(-)
MVGKSGEASLLGRVDKELLVDPEDIVVAVALVIALSRVRERRADVLAQVLDDKLLGLDHLCGVETPRVDGALAEDELLLAPLELVEEERVADVAVRAHQRVRRAVLAPRSARRDGAVGAAAAEALLAPSVEARADDRRRHERAARRAPLLAVVLHQRHPHRARALALHAVVPLGRLLRRRLARCSRRRRRLAAAARRCLESLRAAVVARRGSLARAALALSAARLPTHMRLVAQSKRHRRVLLDLLLGLGLLFPGLLLGHLDLLL